MVTGRSKKLDLLYTGNQIFKDKDILKKGHHPASLDMVQHRDQFIEKYILYLRDLTNTSVPDNILVYGGFGAGKTMLSKLITLEVKNELIGNKKDVYIVYIYCETLKIVSKIMRHINKELSKQLSIQYKLTGPSVGDHFDQFYQLINTAKFPVILIFDEIDKLVYPDFINQLARIKECGFTGNNICIIGITNDTNFYNSLDGRTQSILSKNQLYITPYNAEELVDILESRVIEAFYPGICDPLVVPLCAAIGAQESGDARTAIQILRTAGELAELRNASNVTEADVLQARDTIEMNAQINIINELPTHIKIVLLSILFLYKRNEKIYTSNIVEFYLKICTNIAIAPVSYRRVTDYTKELGELGLVTITKISKGNRKGVMNLIVPIIDIESAENTILKDNRFDYLKK